MIIRTKDGYYRAVDSLGLLDFLGVRDGGQSGRRVAVAGDVELITSVPLAMNNEGGIPWTFSTFDLDRFGERIDPFGWDFEQYCKNPVVEWAHCYHIPAIGRAEGVHVDGNGLHGVLVFNDKEYDAFGWGIGQRVKAGVIRAGSVGFRVMEIEIPSKEDSRDGTSLIFRKQELLEFSVCNIPTNPFALAKKEKGKEKKEEREEGNGRLAMTNEQCLSLLKIL